MVLVAWLLASNKGVVRKVAAFAGLYCFETAFELIPSSNQALTLFLNTMQMLIEWTIVAAVLLTLKDKLMFVVAAAIGVVTGIMYLAASGVPDSGYVTDPVAYALTGLCIAYGFVRQRPELKGTNWLLGR